MGVGALAVVADTVAPLDLPLRLAGCVGGRSSCGTKNGDTAAGSGIIAAVIVDAVELDFSPSAWAAGDPTTVAERLRGFDARWMVIGGWALDAYRERQTRPHEDLEIATPIWDFPQLRDRLDELEFFVAGREGFWPVDGAGGAYFQYQQTLGETGRPVNGALT